MGREIYGPWSKEFAVYGDRGPSGVEGPLGLLLYIFNNSSFPLLPR